MEGCAMTVFFSRLPQTAQRIILQFHSVLESVARKRAYPQLSATPFFNLRRIKRRSHNLLCWPGIAGIGLLSACVALYFSAILPLQEKLASTSSSVIALQERKNHVEPGARQRTPEELLDEFYRMFPADRNMPEYLEKIFTLAQTRGIRLDQGQYRIIPGKGGNLVSLQMTLPVKGKYPQIRQFLADLMADIPFLSLQQVQFKRQKVGNPRVEANIRLELYLLEQRL
jgi:hypothetical protein